MGRALPSLYLIKLGGSLITDKDKLNSFQKKPVQRLFKQLSRFYDKKKYRLIIGNGAGANTHYLAKKYQTILGSRTFKDWQGCCAVKESALRHHSLINRLGIEAGLPLFSYSPSTMFLSKQGETKQTNFSSLLYGLQKGLVPHLYGDVILDEKTGTTIYSTEKLFLELMPVLIKHYRRPFVYFLGDTKGVLNKKQRTILKISSRSFLKQKQFIGESRGFDVTGGMLSKVQLALKMAALGCEVYIASGLNFSAKYLIAPQKQKDLTHVIA